MRRFKFLTMVVVALLVSLWSGTVIAQEPPPMVSVSQAHLLVRAEDVASFGNVEVLVPEGAIEKGGPRDHGVLTGWQKGHSIDMLVIAQGGKYTALINSASYEFLSPAAAQAALNALPDPISDGSWRSVAKDALVLNRSVTEALKGRTWCVWQGVDDEGLPAYVLWIQHGPYIAEAHVNVGPGQEVFGQQLFNHIADRLTKKITTGTFPVDISKAQLLISSSRVPPSPKWWASDVRADHFEFPQWWHVLAVWMFPHGHAPHFHGRGGDATTCNSNHGCFTLTRIIRLTYYIT